VLALIALWFALYASFNLFHPPLLDDADSVHSEVAREMIVRHDWVTLYANGIRYLEKAPVMYWSIAASFLLLGPHDWAARLPLACYTLALFLSVFVLGRRLFGSNLAGAYGALILETSFGIFLFTRIMIPDVIVCFWLALAMLFFWNSLDRPSRATAWGFAAVCALDVLTKGLIGIVFPLAIILVFLWLTKNLQHLRRWHPISSLIVFLAIAVPWHVAAGLHNPSQGHPSGLMPTQGNVHGYFWFYFVDEQILRYLNLRVPHDYDTVPLFLFWGLLIVWLMPWIAYIVRPLRDLPVRLWRTRAPLSRPQQAATLLFIWAAFVMLFFSFSTRQEYYALPALPPLALLLGSSLAREETGEQRYSLRTAGMLLAFGVSGAAIAFFLAWHGTPPPPGTDLSTLLSQNPGDYALSLGHFLDLSARSMGAFRLPLLLTGLSISAGTILNFLLRRKEKFRAANFSLAAMMCVFLTAAHMALVTFSPVLTSKGLAAAIQKQLRPGDIVEINGEYEAGSTLGFYLHRQVRILNGRSSNLWYGSFFDDAPRIFDNDASFRQLWSGPARIFLWTEQENPPALPGGVYVIAREGGKEILSNREGKSQ
jgi:4-amino-4-deoxy-L-arabinose transferase-like glycosyltransferase